MFNSRCVYTMRAVYHAAAVLSNTDILNKNNNQPLIQEVVNYSFDDNQGVIPQKTALLKI